MPRIVHRAVLFGVAVREEAVDVHRHLLDAAGFVDHLLDAVAFTVVKVVGPQGGAAAAGLSLEEGEFVGVVPRKVAVGVFRDDIAGLVVMI